jgi:hypothetical protein
MILARLQPMNSSPKPLFHSCLHGHPLALAPLACCIVHSRPGSIGDASLTITLDHLSNWGTKIENPETGTPAPLVNIWGSGEN